MSIISRQNRTRVPPIARDVPLKGGNQRQNRVYYRDLLVVVLLLFMSIFALEAFLFPRRIGPNGDIVPPLPTFRPRGIDPNTAEWYELAQLPRIGEKIAKRMVQYRRDQQKEVSQSHDIFERPNDLKKIRGIGDKTLQHIKPFLRFDGSHTH